MGFLAAEEQVPGRSARQDDAQLTGTQVDASAGDRLGIVAHKDVRPQRVVHVIPERDTKRKKKASFGREGQSKKKKKTKRKTRK